MTSFIQYGDHGKIPEGAKELNSDQLLEFLGKAISTWEPYEDIWALRFGPGIIGAASAATGIWLNYTFRRKLRLGIYGQFTTYFPIAVLPTAMTIGVQQMIVQPEIMLKPFDCPLCLQTKASVYQLGVGIVQPLLLASVSTILYALRYHTYRIPPILSNPKLFWQFYVKFLRPMTFPLSVSAALHIAVVQYITHKERQHFFYMMEEMSRDIPRGLGAGDTVEVHTRTIHA